MIRDEMVKIMDKEIRAQLGGKMGFMFDSSILLAVMEAAGMASPYSNDGTWNRKWETKSDKKET